MFIYVCVCVVRRQAIISINASLLLYFWEQIYVKLQAKYNNFLQSQLLLAQS